MVLLTRLVRERLPVGACILDAGCGHGNYVIDELKDRIGNTVGIDADPSCTAKNVCLDEIVYGRLEQLPFADLSFDAVISLWVLEHLEEPDKTFAEIHRVLKPGGFFAFVTPNRHAAIVAVRRVMKPSFAKRLVKRLYGRDDQDTFDVHYRANTIGRLSEVARKVGFSVTSLNENADPSYTSFGAVTYAVSAMSARMNSRLARPHIIGILEKPLV